MVAELLRLRLRLVGNLYRRRAAAGRIVGVVAAIALVVLVFAGVRLLDGSGPQFAARSIVGFGSLLSLGTLLVPVIVARHELMPARAFLGFGVPRRLLIPLVAVYIPLVVQAGIIDIDHWRHYYLIVGLIWGVTAGYYRLQPGESRATALV